MAERRTVPLVFGRGLDRETGVMAARRTSMHDLRNVYLHQGKMAVRDGMAPRLTFADSAGNPATHILAGEALAAERSGIVVAYEQDNTGEVNVYQIDAEATSGTRIGTWFTLEVGTEPPIVVTAESYGRVFMAHDELRVSQREPTVVYNPRRGSVLETLTADLENSPSSEAEPIAFRGVTRHLAYIFGYGFGTAAEDRPELVRSSLPAAPEQFHPEHYWIVGDRRDPVMAVKRAGQAALVFKEAETHQITGSGRDDFAQQPLDTLHGILAPRLAVTVGNAVYGWSAEGPRRWQPGVEGSTDLELPLDIDGFEPDDLVAQGELRRGFAHYIPSEQVVVFVFGQRVYALSIRDPQSPEWSYWELGITPFCAFTLRSLGAGVGAESQTAPTGHPEFLNNISPRDNDELRIKWKNVGQDGDERVNIWTRELVNLVDDWALDVDSDGDGVVDGWTETDDANLTTAFTQDEAAEAQKIEVTAASGAGFSYIEQTDLTSEPIVAGDDYGIAVSVQVANLVAGGHARLIYRWFDDTDTQIGSDHVLDDATDPAEFERAFQEVVTAPAGAVRLDVLLGFAADAGGDTGTVWYRDVSVDPVSQRGAWDEQGSFLVATTTEQDQRLGGYESGTFHQVALRYKRSVFVTAGYEGDDPSQWPIVSRGVASTPLQAASLTFEHWFYGEHTSGATGHGLAFKVDFEEGVKTRLQEAFNDGKAAGIEVWRKRPGVAGETEFTLHEEVPINEIGADNWYVDDALGEDTSSENEEDYEYKIRTFISNTKSGFSEVVTRWPGPCYGPTQLQVAPGDASGELDRAWVNDDDEEHFGAVQWFEYEDDIREAAGTAFGVDMNTLTERRNVTAATSFALNETFDQQTSDTDAGLNPGDEHEYRMRYRLDIGASDQFYSPYSNLASAVVP